MPNLPLEHPLVDAYLTLRDPLLLPAIASQASLTFWQLGAGVRGGMAVQISTDAGVTATATTLLSSLKR